VLGFVNYKKGCIRLPVASDKFYQLLAHGRWFSPGTPASSTTKTGHHDIAEILLKVALKHQKSPKNQVQINTKMFYANMILKISLFIQTYLFLLFWLTGTLLLSIFSLFTGLQSI
jgi:hypothetical protein